MNYQKSALLYAAVLVVNAAPGLSPLAQGQVAQIPGAAEPSAQQLSEVHSVRSGDTLWDLCRQYLNSPWYWPKIWSYNPQITNPHWIYPGNELRFYPSDESLPTNVEIAQQEIALPEGDDLEIPDSVDPDDLVKTVGKIVTGQAVANSVWTAQLTFVSEARHARAGQLVNSDEEGVMLSDFDRAYIRSPSPLNKGESYAVYRSIRRVVHPINGRMYGYAVEIVGGLIVLDVGNNGVSKGKIMQAYRPIERGDYVGPWPESHAGRVSPVANQAETQGYIMETAGDVIAEVGEHHFVYIDRGRSHGVQSGNTFAVLARGDGLTRETAGLPNELIGRLMVIETQEQAATAVVISSFRELQIGDKIAMSKN